MSNKVIGADNQQATSQCGGASETTRQAPFSKLEILAYLNGALHDASLNKMKRFRFAQKSRLWLEKLQILLREIDYNSWIYKEGKNRNVYVLETLCSKLSFRFDPKKLKTTKEKIMYIRGFFDAEGGIPRVTGKFYIQLVQKDYGKISALKELLRELSIESGKIHNPSRRINPDYWRIFILTRHHKRFAEIINSWHPIKSKIFSERLKI